MGAGTIIYLNGTSSSGKTSITRALHEQLSQPYLHCPIDLFEMMIPERQIERGVFPELNAIQSGFTACIAALASAGNNVIVDDVLCEPFGYPEDQAPMTARELLDEIELHPFEARRDDKRACRDPLWAEPVRIFIGAVEKLRDLIWNGHGRGGLLG